jgi:hypothetical protein
MMLEAMFAEHSRYTEGKEKQARFSCISTELGTTYTREGKIAPLCYIYCISQWEYHY